VRDFAYQDGDKTIGARQADSALSKLEVDGSGLDSMDRRYLNLIIENYAGGPVGIETIAAVLSEQRDMIEDVVEPYLLQQGFVQRTPRGRMVSVKGYEYFGLKPKKPMQEQMFEDEQ
jgi:Holliday junction DNA helicase RuvB